MSILQIDKKRIAQSFSLKAATYSSCATVQTHLVQRICTNLNAVMQKDQLWADIGSGPGTLLQCMESIPKHCSLLCLDLANEPLKLLKEEFPASRIRALRADGEHLPLKQGRFDGAVMASMLQWAHSPATLLTESARILKQNGTLLFSFFLDGSFKEIYTIRQNHDLPLSASYPSVDSVCRLLGESGFDSSSVIIDEYTTTMYYSSAFDALKSISSIGAAATGGPLLKRKQLIALCKEYEAAFGTEKGIPVTYNAATGKIIKANR
ncbi:methyltransferase domain-containing protein [Chitinispirillales bacterium ANBcel5]|uniref:methyltransferase domain-containing protein n=1 Tax=Cellulosispirillum alkaliphilum TaxID=3039283 RepID=UPI002A565494|nr:methyltransferase domain-containing protein [Chitinispirillales bacterium ANBcel5]